ncbi:DNA circularization protein [Pseudomonas sp.]|uniref:DNA circularization protein n=1 Tax=Pseudomonas sp. TaxID=306 RepID=UPI003D0A6B3A
MSWKEKLLPGSFRGVSFKVESADGEIGRRIALHQYPLRDKPFAEDLGRQARSFTLDLFAIGADYMTHRDALINAFETQGPGLLVHPYLGEMTVTVLEARGPRETTREGGMARFSVVFVESGEARFPRASADTARAVVEKADLAATVLQREFASAFDAAGRPEFIGEHAKTLVGKVADKLDAIRRGIPGVPAQVTAFVADLQRFSAGIESLLRTPADLAAEIYGLVGDVALLPDRPDRAIKAYRQLWDALSGEPEISRTTASRVRQADNQQALQGLVQRSAVIEAARSAATVDFASYDDAAALRLELADRLDAEMDTADDETYRVLTDLRVALVRDLNARSANLARVVRYTPTLTLPALVVAYRLYDDAGRDGEIAARNSIRHPGFVTGGRELEVLTDA